MPANIKLGVSVLALAVAFVFAWFEHSAGRETLAWVAAGTGIFAVVSMWIFPEATRKR